jgi:NTE family protein
MEQNKIMRHSLFTCFRTAWLLLILVVWSGVGVAQSTASEDEFIRPKIGLVLSGGGARGAAHVGVLKILEENRIPIDMVAGTSFGALVGGLYSAGYSASELEEVLQTMDWSTALSSQAPRNKRSFKRKEDDYGFLIRFKLALKNGQMELPSGLLTTNNLRLTLRDMLSEVASIEDFDKLPIPFRAVSTNLETGQATILGTGNLASAMVASMAVPALFPPVERDGLVLVDGGISNNVPIDVAREMGADIVIVVDIGSPLKNRDEMHSFTSVIDQLTLILTNKSANAQLATLTGKDVVIRPDLTDIGFADFENAINAVPKGEESTLNVLSQLQEHMLKPREWQAHMDKRAHNGDKPLDPVVEFIDVVNTSEISDEVIRTHLSQKTGEKLDALKMSSDLTSLYGYELFAEVDYSTVTRNGKTGIEVSATRPKNGEDAVRFGLALQDDLDGESGYQLAAGYTNRAINDLGGEWQTLLTLGDEFSIQTEFYQPIDYSQQFYVFSRAFTGKANANVFDDDQNIVGEVRLTQSSLEFGGGLNLANWGTIRTGLVANKGHLRGRIAIPRNPKISFDSTAFYLEFQTDTLDNVKFPHSGSSMGFNYSNGLSLFGGDSKTDAIQLGGYIPATWGLDTFGLSYSFGSTMNEEPNDSGYFDLGGFLSLTAYQQGQLRGNHVGTLAMLYYRRISGGSRFLTQTPIYVGGSIETGGAWDLKDDIGADGLHYSSSIFVAADTFVGPIYLGLGVGDEGNKSAFLFVGQLF